MLNKFNYRFLFLATITFLLFVSCSNKKIFFQQFQKDWIMLMDTAALLEEREARHMEILEQLDTLSSFPAEFEESKAEYLKSKLKTDYKEDTFLESIFNSENVEILKKNIKAYSIKNYDEDMEKIMTSQDLTIYRIMNKKKIASFLINKAKPLDTLYYFEAPYKIKYYQKRLIFKNKDMASSEEKHKNNKAVYDIVQLDADSMIWNYHRSNNYPLEYRQVIRFKALNTED